MRDQFLFVIAPYLAALAVVPVCIARYVLWSRQLQQAGTDFASGDRGCRITPTWRCAIGFVALGHLLAFTLVDAVLIWNRHPIRLLLLEGSGLIAGSVALVTLLAMVLQSLCEYDQRGAPSPFDVIAGTLILIEVACGVAVAWLYRWGSSWSEVTLAPYLHSLLRLEPSTILVTRLPFLVRLHVFCAFALLAVAPFSDLTRSVIFRVDRLTRRMVARGANVLRPAWWAIEEWSTKRVRPLHAIVRNDEEEN
jgi:nitrate reductase gamma subunit